MAGFSGGCAFAGEEWTRLRSDLEDLDFCLDGFIFAMMMYDANCGEEMVISNGQCTSPDFVEVELFLISIAINDAVALRASGSPLPFRN